MKHNLKITLLLLSMFILTQFLGLYVVDHYSPVKVVNGIQENVTSPNHLPLGLEPPPENNKINAWQTLLYIIPAFIIAILIFFFLTKIKSDIFMKIWFSLVIVVALFVSVLSFVPASVYAWIIALAISLPLAFFKIIKRNIMVHNITEMLIYPGIAAIFVALLSSPENPSRGLYSVMALLILISVYDMWAVWHSGIMQKMAKYQINKLRIFGGFLIPYLSKQVKAKLKKLKRSGKRNKNKRIKVNFAILGGGDIVFPAITAGVVLRKFGFSSFLGVQLPLASLLVILGAVLGLGFLLFLGKKKPYPAMPFLSAGMFVALGACYLIWG